MRHFVQTAKCKLIFGKYLVRVVHIKKFYSPAYHLAFLHFEQDLQRLGKYFTVEIPFSFCSERFDSIPYRVLSLPIPEQKEEKMLVSFFVSQASRAITPDVFPGVACLRLKILARRRGDRRKHGTFLV